MIMADEDSYKVPKFDGRNFGLWKKHVIVVMKTKGLSVTLTAESKATEALDLKAQAIILGALDQSVTQKIISCDTAAEMWQRLRQIYENTSPANVGKVFEAYYSYKKEAGDDMATHISKVEAMVLHLEEVGEQQSEVSVMSKLLHSLPASYSSLKEAWDSVHPDLQTKTNLVARMLSHDPSEGKPTDTKDVALVAGRRQEPTKTRPRMDKRKVKCYNCGNLGHFLSRENASPGRERNTRPQISHCS